MIHHDLIILGGGSSGLMAAITAKDFGLDVAIIEGTDRIGKKILTTGNGRCNISNVNLDISKYHGDPCFAYKLIDKFNYNNTKDFFEKLGVIIKVDEKGRAYPYSLQASSVVDALRFECDKQSIKTVLNCEITEIIKKDNLFIIKSEDYIFNARAVILAFGGQAGGNLYGTDGSAYKLFKNINFIDTKRTSQVYWNRKWW